MGHGSVFHSQQAKMRTGMISGRCRSLLADTMDIHPVRPGEIADAFELLVSHGWRKRLASAEQFAGLVAASQVAAVAVSSGRVVGFVRAITDGISNGYLSMLVVAPEYRQKGVGRALVAHALAANPHGTWVLRAGRDGAVEFFARLGFQPSSIAMERPRA